VRARRTCPVLLATLAAAVPATAHADTTCPDRDLVPAADNLGTVAGAMLCAMNEQRLAAGLAPLRRSVRLDRGAQYHGQDMAFFGYFAHQRPGEPSLVQRIRATGYFTHVRRALYTENLADAPQARDSAGAVVDAWMESPEHRTNLLIERFREAGIAVVPVPASEAFYSDTPSTLFVVDYGRRYMRHRHKRRSG
jgi:uncharacterized protein YkwD